MPRLLALSKYWREHPPVHVLVAAFVGYKPKEQTKTVNSPEELEQLARLLGGRG